MGGMVAGAIDPRGVIYVSGDERSPDERGREAAEAMMAGAGHIIEESIKSAWWLAKWGCIAYTIYCVVGCVVAFVLAAALDLLDVIPPWLVVAGFVLALVIHFATREA